MSHKRSQALRNKDQRSLEIGSIVMKEKQVGRLDLSLYEAFQPTHRSSVDLSREEICMGAPGAKCGLPVGDDDEGVECDMCHRWYHSTCQGVTSGAYKALQEHPEILILAWICKECKTKIKEDKNKKKENEKLEEKIDALMDIVKDQTRIIRKSTEEHEEVLRELGELQGRNFNTLHEQNEAINSRIERMTGSSTGEKKETEKTYADVAKKTCEQIISTLGAKLDVLPKVDMIAEDIKKVIKTRESEDRATNILVHNVPESRSEKTEVRKEEDLKKFKEIAEALGVSNIEVKSDVRLRRHTETTGNSQSEVQGNKPRIMMLKLCSKEEVDTLYRRRFDLKSKGIENTYITKDLDPEEREKQRKLREEWIKKGKDTHVIYRGKVVVRKGNKHQK